MDENLDNEIVDDSIDDDVVVDDGIVEDAIIGDDEPISDDINAGEILLIDKTSSKWVEFSVSDWTQTGAYYKLVIPYDVHKCLNAYVSTMLIPSGADSGDSEDENGLENNIPTWKLLTNDSIVIKSDNPVDCKILIKGER